MDVKKQIHSNTVMAEDFNTPLMSTDKSSRQKIKKKTMALNGKIDQMDLKYYFNISCQSSRIYILFKCT